MAPSSTGSRSTGDELLPQPQPLFAPAPFDPPEELPVVVLPKVVCVEPVDEPPDELELGG